MWKSALSSPESLTAGNDYMVVAYGFNNIGGNQVHYLNGPTGTTVGANILHDRSYYNSGGRGVNDAPDTLDPGSILQYAGPTFEYNTTALSTNAASMK